MLRQNNKAIDEASSGKKKKAYFYDTAPPPQTHETEFKALGESFRGPIIPQKPTSDYLLFRDEVLNE